MQIRGQSRRARAGNNVVVRFTPNSVRISAAQGIGEESATCGRLRVDMMRDHIDQNLRCGPDRLPLLLSLIDERLSFSVQALRLFDNRLGPIEKIDQRLGRWHDAAQADVREDYGDFTPADQQS